MKKLLPSKKKIKSYRLGKWAEQHTTNYLIHNNWSIIANNFKTIYGEIDIIAIKNKCLVAFEIKTRTDIEILQYTISKKQQLRITNAFNYFLSNNPHFFDCDLRLDVIFVFPNKQIKHIENAWDNSN